MKSVLLIEDNEEIRDNMAEIVELAGYRAITASNGRQGVAIALEEQPDLIVCDIMMPELDGYAVIHLLQKNNATKHIPFIFLTAKAERSEIRKGMEMGADDYITKPFNGTELLNAIESRLKKYELLKTEVSQGIEGLKSIISYAGGRDILQVLEETGTTNKFKKKQVIYSEGNHALRLFYVEHGKVRTYKTNDEGKEFVTGIYNEGDFFGYVTLLEKTVYKDTAEALEDCAITVISKDSFEELIYSNRDVLEKFIELLAKNVTEREQQLLGLAYNSLRKKVANALVTINAKYRTNSGKPYPIDISRDNLAAIAGTAKESLIRTLGDFKEERLIEIIKGDIFILNEEKLRNMLN